MLFSRLIVNNPEQISEDDHDKFIFKWVHPAEKPPEPTNTYTFYAKHIELLNVGWVLVEMHDAEPIQCFPPWRVIALEGRLL